MNTQLVKKEILEIGVTDGDIDEVLEYVYDSVKKNDSQVFAVTPNPEIVMYAMSHPAYKKILNEANLSLCDGIGLYLASYILNKPLKARITGTDLMIRLCSQSSDQALSIGLLGAGQGVAEKTAQCLQQVFPKIDIVFAKEELSPAEISRKKVDLLFVAYGFPKQEEWIHKHKEELSVKFVMGVGGAFDYISENVKRAPFIIRFLGFEWLYRLIKEPWRWRRQIALLKFVGLVLVSIIKRAPAKR